jgi:hypothetical protein
MCQLREWREPFLDALSELGITGVFMTDESALSDFCLDDDDRGRMAARLGVPVGADDYVVDVLARLSKKETTSDS